MTAPQTAATTGLQSIIAALQQRLDAALSEKATLADELVAQIARTVELADRKTEFDERIEHQAATVDVLRVMSASPGDTQPVFDLIVRRAVELCNAQSGGLFEYDGEQVHIGTIHGLYEHDGKLLHVQSLHGTEPNIAPAALAAYLRQFPMPPKRGSISMRAILDSQIMHIRDMREEVDLLEDVQRLGHRSQVSVPLLRDARAIGVITMAAHEPGGFSDSQVQLLKTFAEQAVIAITSAETYRALRERTAALAARNSEYGERIEQQAATIDVLKVMSSSPGNAQPVFQLIVERARAFCGADQTNLALLDGAVLHLEATSGASAGYRAQFPRPLDETTTFGKAIIACGVVQTPDVLVDPDHFRRTSLAEATVRAVVAVPLLRRRAPVGAIAMGRNIPGEFSATQMELLKTFAEQAVIAISSAETYRALQTRTSELQETLEYQTATSNVLKVISRSTFDLQPVLDAVAETAARLCDADQALIATREGERVRMAANFGFPAEIWALWMARGPRPLVEIAMGVGPKTILEGRIVHMHDVAAARDYPVENIAIGRQRTTLGVPLVRDGETIGSIVLARQRVEPFTDRQIELVTTFADQAVIAIENTRLITEQREALEQQTATAEVLQVINASPGHLAPVFDTMLDNAMHLCGAAFGELVTFDGEHFKHVAVRGVPAAYAEYRRANPHPPGVPGSIPVRLRDGEDCIHVSDLMADEIYRSGNPSRRAMVDLGGARTLCSVALRKDVTLLGYITIYRQEVRPFSNRQIALLENFAAQAVIAMENARLLTEQREALEQQTATAEVLQVINSSPGNLVPVFDTMLESAMRLCEASFGELYSYEDEVFHPLVFAGVPPAYAAYKQKRGDRHTKPDPGSMAAQIVAGERVVHIGDLKDTDDYRSGSLNRRAMVDLGGARSAVSVALRKDAELRGGVVIYRQEMRPFSEKQIALLENFAAQAVIAMDNAQLLTEQQEALEQQTATAEVLGVINSSPGNLTPVFEAMLDKAMRLCNAAFGSLYVLDGEHLRSVAQRGPEAYANYRAAVPPSSTGGIVADLIRGKRPIHVLDMKDRERYRAGYPDARAIVDIAGARTTVLVPFVKDDTFVGYISIFRQEVQAFSDKQITLLQNFAAQAVIAMENARLLTETREALEQQTATAAAVSALGGFRTALFVPLRKDGTLLGHITTLRSEIRPFTDKQIALLQNFAAQAVIAMENARLINEQREALEQQTATAEVLQVINASPGNLVPVFEGILEKATRLCQSSFGVFATYDGQTFQNVAFRGIQPAHVELLSEPVHPRPGTSLYRIAQGENIVQVADIKDDEAYRLGVPNRRLLVELAGARTQLVVALRKDDTLLGAMNVFRQEVRPFSNKQIALLQNFASQAVIAMENARLLGEIKQRQEELRITFENMGDGVAMFDADLRLAAWNQNFRQIIELPDSILPERPTYTDYLRLLAERGEFGAADVETELRRRIEDTDKELRLERVRPDGRVIEVRRNAVPGGGFVLIYSDITERKRSETAVRAARDAAEAAYRELKAAQANLIQAEKMASLGQLTAGIAHEIKNPLNFVNNFAALSVDLLSELKETAAPGFAVLTDKQRAEVEDVSAMLTSNLEKITEHGQRADGIVRAMLEHSRGSSGERRIVDLNALIDEALNLAYHGARAQDQSFNITLERDFGASTSPIEVTPQDITRVFLNLFSNGFYAATRRARAGGEVGFVPTLTVSTRDAGEVVEIRVRDNGTGIPAGIRDKLFQPFFTTKPTGEGTGLGLSITYDIVTQQHGGDIAVDSKVGDYSEFTIRLPRSP